MSKHTALLVCSALIFVAVPPCSAVAQQRLDLPGLLEELEKTGRVVVGQGSILIEKYDFDHESRNVEALVIRPASDGPHPSLVLIPGHGRTATDYLPLGVRFAREGLACMAISQRGYGRSEGEPDFVGPKTIAALAAGLDRFRKEPYVDPSRVAVFGYSRGAMAASLLATQTDTLAAAILAAGIYDFKSAYDSIQIAGIRENMEKEAGLSETAIRERSSILAMDQLKCPVLILHGAKDENAPFSQAEALRDRLQELGRPFKIQVYADRDHDIGMQNLLDASIPFLQESLKITRDGS